MLLSCFESIGFLSVSKRGGLVLCVPPETFSSNPFFACPVTRLSFTELEILSLLINLEGVFKEVLFVLFVSLDTLSRYAFSRFAPRVGCISLIDETSAGCIEYRDVVRSFGVFAPPPKIALNAGSLFCISPGNFFLFFMFSLLLASPYLIISVTPFRISVGTEI